MNHASFYSFTIGVFVFEPCFPSVSTWLHFYAVVVTIPETFGVVGFPDDFAPTIVDL